MGGYPRSRHCTPHATRVIGTCAALTSAAWNLCQNAGASLVDKLPSPQLTQQQQDIGKVILGLIAFQVIIGFISSAMSGGGGGGYSV